MTAIVLMIEPILVVQKLYEAKNGFTKVTKKLRHFIQPFDQSTLTWLYEATSGFAKLIGLMLETATTAGTPYQGILTIIRFAWKGNTVQN